MSSSATPGVEARTGRENRTLAATDAIQPETQSAIPGLSDDVVIGAVLGRTEDPTDLARLRAVSREMRDAVAATGLRFVELPDYTAAALGCLSALQRLQRRGRLTRRDHFCQAAARVGNLEELKALRANGTPWDADTCAFAARRGYLEVLQWAHANGCPWDERTCSYAARGGHLDVLLWARANGCPWDSITCSWAAEGGHLEVLQWARANGCPWSEWTCYVAAKGGHLEVLQWARANGCPWGEWTCYFAAKGGHLNVLQWARENGCL